MAIDRSMKYEVFIAETCDRLKILPDNLTFAYTVEADFFFFLTNIIKE